MNFETRETDRPTNPHLKVSGIISEVAEESHETELQELEEARALVTRLTAYQACAVGIDSRLTADLQEKDELRQERDNQAQRAKSTEA